MPTLTMIVTSTREQRKGEAVARWALGRARAHGAFDVTLVDLREVGLPMLDEPEHPRKQQYHHDHTRRWSATIAASDAFVFVVPEYNHGMPPALLNALDYLYVEWNYKPAAFVSYGGVSGGTRSVQMAKPVLTGLRVMPIPEAVNIPFFSKYLGEDGEFTPGEAQDRAVAGMLDELARWSGALTPLRAR